MKDVEKAMADLVERYDAWYDGMADRLASAFKDLPSKLEEVGKRLRIAYIEAFRSVEIDIDEYCEDNGDCIASLLPPPDGEIIVNSNETVLMNHNTYRALLLLGMDRMEKTETDQ